MSNVSTVIEAFRNTSIAFSTAPYYGANSKKKMLDMIERLIGYLKKGDTEGFWVCYNSNMNEEVDLVCEIMEEVFARLGIDMVDPLVEMLA